MRASAPLLALLLLGARAQHSSEWTYSGKPPPQGLRLSSLPSPLLGLPSLPPESALTSDP